mmetsp:Transcript_4936/g.12479  ORF Transcript_4936/g.12479 Transcript_4936/m.12479 type:complete len:216 (-) Transcript_4936:1166-1813(-)
MGRGRRGRSASSSMDMSCGCAMSTTKRKQSSGSLRSATSPRPPRSTRPCACAAQSGRASSRHGGGSRSGGFVPMCAIRRSRWCTGRGGCLRTCRRLMSTSTTRGARARRSLSGSGRRCTSSLSGNACRGGWPPSTPSSSSSAGGVQTPRLSTRSCRPSPRRRRPAGGGTSISSVGCRMAVWSRTRSRCTARATSGTASSSRLGKSKRSRTGTTWT